MTGPRGFRQARCGGCGLTRALCVCRLWPPLAAPFEISLVMPPEEARAASNSARLAALWLPQSRLQVRGQGGLREPGELVRRPGSALLFPGGSERRPLPAAVRHLIVPDGTWAQARRIERRWFAPYALPRVELDPGLPSVYGLRRGRSGPCTFEAVAIAIGLLADPGLAQDLLERFAEWARRARWLKAGGGSEERAARHAAEHGAERTRHPAAVRLWSS